MRKITQFFQKNYLLLLFTAASFVTRFFYFSRPNEIVFDETYFGKFILHYFSGTNYFDIHPPFGKILIFFFAKILGFNFFENQDPITLIADPKNLFILRLVPAIFGFLLVPLIYKFVETISNSKKAAALAAIFILFDNAFLVYSRFVFLDIILVFFGILALWLFLVAINYSLALNYSKKEQSPIFCDRRKEVTLKKQISRVCRDRDKHAILIMILYFVFSAISLGAAIGIKWTGLAIWGIIIATLFWKFLRKQISFKKWAAALIIYIVIPALFYIIVFAGHFAIIKKIGDDSAFFTPEYLKILQGNSTPQNTKPLNFWGKFKEINKTMFSSNSGLSATHPYASQWWQWPLSQKPVYLWQGKTNSTNTANIWLFGNLVIWFTGFLAILFVILNTVKNFIKHKKQEWMTPTYWLLFAYLANLLPFILIKRVLFLYHYFFSAIFAITLLSILLAKLLELYPKTKKFIYIFIAAAIIFFILFSPLSYGFLEPVKFYNFQLKFIW